MRPLRILVIEDDRELCRLLARGLGEEGHSVALAHDGVNGLAQLCTGGFDVCVLDVRLPLRDGFDVLADARAVGVNTPVLMLTARDAVEDRVRGLSLGADDYLVKPFAFAELAARVAAVARRGAPKRERERIGHLELDSAAHRVLSDGKELELSAKQYALLEFLVRHRGEVVSRSMILRQVFGYSFEAVSNIVDVHISSLRQKIDRPGEPSLIVTVRGVGYRLEART